jgi:hypothetical protein
MADSLTHVFRQIALTKKPLGAGKSRSEMNLSHASGSMRSNKKGLFMAAIYHAAIMDAETGGNSSHKFEAAADLFSLPPRDIVDAFITSLDAYGKQVRPLAYELDSAILKREKQVVMATGSLGAGADGIPFVLIISPLERKHATAP